MTAPEDSGSELGSSSSPHFRSVSRTLLRDVGAIYLCFPCLRGGGTSFPQGIRAVYTRSAGQDLLCNALPFLLLFYFTFSFHSQVNRTYCWQKKISVQLAKCQQNE